MAIITDFSLYQREDGVLTVSLVMPTNISTWTLQFRAANHFDSESGLIIKSRTQTFDNVSGITVTNAPQGQFNVQINSIDTSGLDSKAYVYGIERLDVGNRTLLSEGFFLLLPSIGP